MKFCQKLINVWVIGMCAWLTAITLHAQSVTFSRLPANLQLYPRNSQNKATVPITGSISTIGYSRMAVVVYRNNAPFTYQTTTLSYINGAAPFTLNADIKAELAEYSFRVYACKSSDSSLVATRTNVVAGDVFLINGQSNASAGSADYSYFNEYARSFGIYTGNNNYDAYNPKDTLWNYSGQGSAYVGVWGTEVQRYIIEKYGIPVCIINGASGGSSIEYNIIRNAVNPADLNTTYGRLLYRVQKAGVQNNIKAILWRQGENETSGNAPGYPGNFNTLYYYWKLDYPSAQKVYVFQVNILDFPLENAGRYVRDFQRRTKGLYPNVETLATVGTMFYDGVHYASGGYKQSGAEVFRLLARDFYGSSDIQNINSPTIKQAYYTTAAKNEIALEFDLPIVYPADSTLSRNGVSYVRKLKDFFYLSAKPGYVTSGSASGNTVFLKLIGAVSESKITYLPSYFSDQYSAFYDGPHLKNSRGMRAFAFYDFPIGDYKDDPKGKEDIVIPSPPTTAETSPLPPSNPVVPIQPPADLSLLMDATNLVPTVDEEIKVSILLKNDGLSSATNIGVHCGLPDGLTFVSSDLLTLSGSQLSAKVSALDKGQSLLFSFKALVKQAGKWAIKAEITSSDQPDTDSTPNNGYDNGEDDTKTLLFTAQPNPQKTTACVDKCVPFMIVRAK